MAYLEGVYWDLDGTIANTELEAHLPAFNKAFKDFELNWYWDKDVYIKLLKINGGKNRISYYSNFNKQSITDDLAKNIHRRKQYYYLKNIQNNAVSLKSGVLRLISELMYKNVRQFIVTSSSKIQVTLLIEKLFINIHPFEFIIASDDVVLHKPNPMPYNNAKKLSGIKESNSIVFEDSNAGLRASLAAKLPTIYLPSNLPTEIDKEIVLNCIIDNLGNEDDKAKVIKGPKLINKYVDYSYLNNYLMKISNAKN